MIIRIAANGTIHKEMNESITESLIVLDNKEHLLAMEYAPKVPGEKARIAVVLMHCDLNYMGLPMGPALARRGYHVLAVQSIQSGDIDRRFEILDGHVRYLRANPDIDKIILMGHSGGATLVTAYQAIAENGPEVFQTDNLIYKCGLKKKLEPADGIMLIDANYGNGVMSLVSLDPAIVEEGCGMKLDPAYDIFDPANGYDKNGANYPAEFVKKYRLAQKRRNDALIEQALERLELISSGKGNFRDDEAFFIAAANQPKPNNRMLPQDLHMLSHTKGTYDLLHGDGSVTHEQIFTVRAPECDRSFSHIYGMGVNKNTVKGFLSSQALRTTEDFNILEDDVVGVDWNSSYSTPVGNIEHIHVPALMMGMTGSYEFIAAEMIYEHAPMEDKTIAFVRGASHMFDPNHAAEKFPGEFGDTEKVLYDYMAKWMERFL